MTTKFPKKIPKNEMIVAYSEIIDLPEEHQYQKGIYLLYEPEIADFMPGYYWAFSKGNKQLNIGLGWMMYPKNVGRKINKVNQKIRERKFPHARVLSSGGDQIPARLPLPSLVHNGFMTVGDAGALANPLTGEGHGTALFSGIRAAEVIMEALKAGDWSEKGLWEYNRWIWKEFGVEFSVGIAVVKFINKHGIKTLDWLMKRGILQEDDIINMVDDAGADMKIVRRALKGWYKPRVLMGLRKLVNHIEELQSHARSYPDPEDFAPWLVTLKQYEAKTF